MRRGTVSERRGRGTVGTRIGADAALYLERPDKLLGVQFKHGDGDVHEQVRPELSTLSRAGGRRYHRCPTEAR